MSTYMYNLNAYLSLAQFVCEVSMILRAENCHSASSRHLDNKWTDIRHHSDTQGLPGNMSPQLQYKLPRYHYLISMYQLLEYFRIYLNIQPSARTDFIFYRHLARKDGGIVIQFCKNRKNLKTKTYNLDTELSRLKS